MPYNIHATWGGYRQDCSGYVSMAARLDQPGPITTELGGYSTLISMAELNRGDHGTDHRVRGYGLEPCSEYQARRLNNVIDK